MYLYKSFNATPVSNADEEHNAPLTGISGAKRVKFPSAVAC